MAKEVVYKCDIQGCASVRTPSDRWFIGYADKGNKIADPMIEIIHFIEEVYNLQDLGNPILLCGEACVHKFISQNLASLHVSSVAAPVTGVSQCREYEDGNVFKLRLGESFEQDRERAELYRRDMENGVSQ